MKDLVDRINAIRTHYNMSGRALAISVDLNYTTINNYLNGTKAPSLEFVMKLLSKFEDISAEWLLRGKGAMLVDNELTNEKLEKELTETKVRLLVAEGVTKELREIILEKNQESSEETRRSLA